ncbi:MAG: hypothetical protein ACFE9D_10975 [Promethearchaeota archaeon]
MQIVELIVEGIIFLILWLFGSLILWLAGKVVSGYNAKFTDALIISLLGTIISRVFNWVMVTFVSSYLLSLGLIGAILVILIPLIIVLIVYIVLIMHFFDTGFLGALAVGILYVIFMVIILIILGIFIGVLILLLLVLFP